MATKKERIIAKAVEIIKSTSDGIRYSDLIRKIQEEISDVPVNTIHGTVWNLDMRIPEEIYKPARGLFRHIKFSEVEIGKERAEPPTKIEKEKMREEDFYQLFANWLAKELEECTKAIPLGGNKFKDKWGTPDVIGKREPLRSDIIKPPTEIISAEIKIDTKI